jgi:hypothetical protein
MRLRAAGRDVLLAFIAAVVLLLAWSASYFGDAENLATILFVAFLVAVVALLVSLGRHGAEELAARRA